MVGAGTSPRPRAPECAHLSTSFSLFKISMQLSFSRRYVNPSLQGGGGQSLTPSSEASPHVSQGGESFLVREKHFR